MKCAKIVFLYIVLCYFRWILWLCLTKRIIFFVAEMKCLLCSLHCIQEKILKKHYVDYHFINDQDIFFKDLFTPIQLRRRVEFAMKLLKVQEVKKSTFLFHYGKHWQIGGNRRTSTLPIVLKITYYSINFDQHRNFYDFF